MRLLESIKKSIYYNSHKFGSKPKEIRVCSLLYSIIEDSQENKLNGVKLNNVPVFLDVSLSIGEFMMIFPPQK